MRLLRLAALAAVLGIAAFANVGSAATSVVAPTEYFCMCYCPGGYIVCVSDTDPNCSVCATACTGVGPQDM
jgi:hypothetical protein